MSEAPRVNAVLGDVYIGSGYSPQHTTDPATVDAIVALVETAGSWTFAPVLVIDEGNEGPMPLDGHHRIEAARALGMDTIPAYIVKSEDIQDLDDYLGGTGRMSDYDEHIIIDNDGNHYTRD